MFLCANPQEYSGGLYAGETLWDMTASIELGSFPPSSANFAYKITYLEVWLEVNWYYFSYVNDTNCIIARSRPDFTNLQTLTTMSLSPVTCQFAIDKGNYYLYYGVENEVMRSLVDGEGEEIYSQISNTKYQIQGVYLDLFTGKIWCSAYYNYGYYFYVFNPTGVTNYYPLSNNNDAEIRNFIVYDDTIFWSSDTEIYLCDKKRGECVPTSLGYSQFVSFDDQTKNVYFYRAASYSISNFYFQNTNDIFVVYLDIDIDPVYFLSILPMECEDGCSAKGNCVLEYYSQYNCSCFTNYYGPTCDAYCTPSTNCTNNGECDYYGDCACNTNYYGPDCSIFCDFQTCNQNGDCSNEGECVCNEYYSGVNCTVPVISPTSPILFSANASLDGNDFVAFYSYQKQSLVLNFTTHLVYKEFVSGYEYFVTEYSCSRSELYYTSLPDLQPSPSSHLIYWNGTMNECVDDSVSKWVDDLNYTQTSLTLVQVCSSPTQYLPYEIEYDDHSIVFDLSTFFYSPPSSIFELPSICL